MTLKEFLEYKFIDIGHISVNPLIIIQFMAVIVVGRLVLWIVNKYILKRLFQQMGNEPGKQYAIQQFVKYIIYVVTTLMALQTVGISLSVLWAGSAALLVGFGLGMQQNFNDLVSGIILLVENSVGVGDIVSIEGMMGKVKKIGLRTSEVETLDNFTIIIPNSKLVVDKVENWSYSGRKSRFHIAVGVAYGSDPSVVRKLLLDVANRHGLILKNPTPSVEFADFGSSSLDFKLHFYSQRYWEIQTIKSDLRFQVFKTFKENDIEIPFPQRDLWLRNSVSLEGKSLV